jgi:hypothetical protein
MTSRMPLSQNNLSTKNMELKTKESSRNATEKLNKEQEVLSDSENRII